MCACTRLPLSSAASLAPRSSVRVEEMSLIIFLLFLLFGTSRSDYWSERRSFIENDQSASIGYDVELNEREKLVNEYLMQSKSKELDRGFNNPGTFAPAQHFFDSKILVEQSDVFKFIQKVPKGASLHSHDTALVSFDYLYNLTFRDNLYGCIVNGRLNLKFFDAPDSTCSWKLLKAWRDEDKTLNRFIRNQLTIVVKHPQHVYPTINDVWNRFLATFTTVRSFVTYRPVFQDYFYQALQELYDDNVFYLEFRGLLPQVYELNGTVYGPDEIVKLYMDTLDSFKATHPKFHGARFIYAPSRRVNSTTCANYIETVKHLKTKYPDFVAGFDLVGPEEKGRPLVDFIPQLLSLSGQVKFFFHAAETDWNGASTDMNIVDAVLLNSTRIGHGYGAVKHPHVLQTIKERSIAIEVCPISNQVLKLVDDLRNHPGSVLMAAGYPVVICCDDPSFWGAKGLSYDWYMAFMGMASRDSDLGFLKQIAMNSIIYSAMENKEKAEALHAWNEQWNEFINRMVIEQDSNDVMVDNM